MLSYRHAYHAGNHADVLKHLVLVATLKYLKAKPKPLSYVDSHAAAGGYSLMESEAQKRQEYQSGIAKLWQRSDLPEPLKNYCELVSRFNPDGKLTRYPGSPWLAAQLLDDADQLWLHELHNSEVENLRNAFRGDRRVKVVHGDGYQGVIALSPPKQRRGMVLIDPSYELKTEYQQVVDTLVKAHRRFATGVYALWYPVVDRDRIDRIEKSLKKSGIRRIQLFELTLEPDNSDYGMTGSGMIVINPPWGLMAEMQSSLTYLVKQLAEQGEGDYRAEELVGE